MILPSYSKLITVKEQWGKLDPQSVEFGVMPLRLRRKAEPVPKPNGRASDVGSK